MVTTGMDPERDKSDREWQILRDVPRVWSLNS